MAPARKRVALGVETKMAVSDTCLTPMTYSACLCVLLCFISTDAGGRGFLRGFLQGSPHPIRFRLPYAGYAGPSSSKLLMMYIRSFAWSWMEGSNAQQGASLLVLLLGTHLRLVFRLGALLLLSRTRARIVSWLVPEERGARGAGQRGSARRSRQARPSCDWAAAAC